MKTRYDIFKHSINVRVQCSKSKRKGIVIEIKETKAECIEPLVKWDDGGVDFARNEELYLDEGLNENS